MSLPYTAKIQTQHRSFLLHGLEIVYFAWIGSTLVAAEPQQTTRVVGIQIQGSSKPVQMHFIPPGGYEYVTLRSGASLGVAQRKVPVEFWIDERELSVGHYNAIRKTAERLQSSFGMTWATLPSTTDLSKRFAAKEFAATLENDDAPIVGLDFIEAVTVCCVLNETRTDSTAATQLTKSEFAIPDASFWEYACVYPRVTPAKLFWNWSDQTVSVDKIEKGLNAQVNQPSGESKPRKWAERCKEITLKLRSLDGSSLSFARTVQEYLGTAKASDDRLANVDAVLNAMLKTFDPPLEIRFRLNLNQIDKPKPDDDFALMAETLLKPEGPSLSGLFGMHGGAGEWVLESEDLPFRDRWNVISGTVRGIPGQDLSKTGSAFIAGGTEFSDNWVEYAVGGGTESRKISDLLGGDQMRQSTSSSGLAQLRGMRLVQFVSMADGWQQRQRVRWLELTAKNNMKSTGDLTKQFDSWVSELKPLSPEITETPHKVLTVQASLLAATHGTKTRGAVPLNQIASLLNDPYYSALEAILSEERK